MRPGGALDANLQPGRAPKTVENVGVPLDTFTPPGTAPMHTVRGVRNVC